MFAKDKGLLVASRPISVNGTGKQTLDMAFLYSVVNRMRAPVIREILLHFQGDISGVTGGFDNEDGCQIFNRIQMRDKGGLFYDLPGKLARVDSQMELGVVGDEVDGLADAASGATTSGDNLLLRIPFDLQYARNGADTALPVTHLTEGGRIDFTFGVPANATGVSGTLVVYALTHDEGRRELKSRLVRTHLQVDKKMDHYPLGGALRSLVLVSNPTGQGYSAYTGSTYSAINVPELEYSAMPAYILREEYRRLRPDASAADVVNAGRAIPLVVPSSGQRIDKMPEFRSITIDLGAAPPTSAELLVSTIEDRDPVLAAEWLGFGDARMFEVAIGERGAVALGGGATRKATTMPARLARRLPIVLQGQD